MLVTALYSLWILTFFAVFDVNIIIQQSYTYEYAFVQPIGRPVPMWLVCIYQHFNDYNAFVFSVKQSSALLGLLDLKMNGLWSLKMLLSIYQSKWSKILKTWISTAVPHLWLCHWSKDSFVHLWAVIFLQEVSLCNRLGYHIIIVYGIGVLGIIAISKTKVMPHVR